VKGVINKPKGAAVVSRSYRTVQKHACMRTRTHIQVFIKFRGSRKSHLTTSHTSQHYFPTLIIPHNHTVRIHAHLPTHTSLTGTCMLMMERVSANILELHH